MNGPHRSYLCDGVGRAVVATPQNSTDLLLNLDSEFIIHSEARLACYQGFASSINEKECEQLLPCLYTYHSSWTLLNDLMYLLKI